MAAPAGFEPAPSESKSDVLPLDEGTLTAIIQIACYLLILSAIVDAEYESGFTSHS